MKDVYQARSVMVLRYQEALRLNNTADDLYAGTTELLILLIKILSEQLRVH